MRPSAPYLFFYLPNARQFYSSMGRVLPVNGLTRLSACVSSSDALHSNTLYTHVILLCLMSDNFTCQGGSAGALLNAFCVFFCLVDI